MLRNLSIFIVAFVISACASAPPNLSQSGIDAFNKLRVVKVLDVLRDVAISGEATVPQLISTNTTRKVVTYHRSTLVVINEQGLKAMSATALDEVLKDLPKKESDILAPYVATIKVVLNEVTKP